MPAPVVQADKIKLEPLLGLKSVLQAGPEVGTLLWAGLKLK